MNAPTTTASAPRILNLEDFLVPTQPTDPNFKSGFVTLLGLTNAGKSTLLNQILQQKISITSRKRQTTRANVLGIHNLPNAQVIFQDTPGIHDENNQLGKLLRQNTEKASEDGDIFLYLLDPKHPLRTNIEQIKKLIPAVSKTSPLLIVINKTDRVEKDELFRIIGTIEENIEPLIKGLPRSEKPIEILSISALKNKGIKLLNQTILKYLPLGPAYYGRDKAAPQRNEFYIAEVIREKIYDILHDELPYSVGVVTEKMEETPKGLKVAAVIYCLRNTQKAIVIGNKGENLRKIGETGRIELGKFFNKPVHLNLFVKVDENWLYKKSILQAMGISDE